jgi:hypothetical protein
VAHRKPERRMSGGGWAPTEWGLLPGSRPPGKRASPLRTDPAARYAIVATPKSARSRIRRNAPSCRPLRPARWRLPVYVVPSATVADYLRSARRAWPATPGNGGKEHRDWMGRFVSPALPFEVPRYPDGWLDEYRDRWDLLVVPSAAADDESAGELPAIADPSDEQILSGMAAGSPGLWARLFEAAGALRSDPEPPAIQPAVQLADGVYSLPYPPTATRSMRSCSSCMTCISSFRSTGTPGIKAAAASLARTKWRTALPPMQPGWRPQS